MDAVIAADDLTGSMDTAHGFAARGRATTVLAIPEARDGDPETDASIVAVNTESRYAEPAAAAAAVTNAVGSVDADVVYKKIDSTLRGNVRAEVDAALSAAGSDMAVVAPAFPAGGRTTEAGVHYVEGTPVAETEYGDDERGPTTSSLRECFEPLDRPVAAVDRTVVERGPDAVASAFREAIDESAPAPIVVCDAVTDDDLGAIAAGAKAFDGLYAGSGGLTEHVAVPGSGETPVAEPHPDRPGGSAPLGVVGSVNATTLGQLNRVPEDAVLELDAVEILRDEGSDAAAVRAVERLDAGEPVVLTAATDREAVERAREWATEHGLASGAVRDRVAAGLGEAAARVVCEREPSGLFLTGGDVAVAVLRALDATTVRLTGEAVGVGVPLGRLADGAVAGRPVVTKAGGFGTEATVVNCLDALSTEHE
jgi:uncharacterized protein YgbK (DUF1537 family)